MHLQRRYADLEHAGHADLADEVQRLEEDERDDELDDVEGLDFSAVHGGGVEDLA